MSDYGRDDHLPSSARNDHLSDNEDSNSNHFTEPLSALPAVDGADHSDDESLLSEVDEAQFADFDATAVQVAPDLETLSKHIKASKRKRAEGEDGPKKRKEGRREKPKRSRRRADSDDGFSGGEEIEGKRARKSKGVEGSSKERKRRAPAQEEINEEHLSPEDRRRRALDRAMDAALKRPSARRMRKGDIVRMDWSVSSWANYGRTSSQALKKKSTTFVGE
jgi:transcription factor SPN1